jgi:hypothetical protein
MLNLKQRWPWLVVLVCLVLAWILWASTAESQPVNPYVKRAGDFWNGRMVSLVTSGSQALAVTSGARICIDGTTCSRYVSNEGPGYFPSAIPFTLTSIYWNGGVPAALSVLSRKPLPARAFTVTAATIDSVSGGTGAGNFVLRVTDGTNNCDATFACPVASNTGLRAATTGTCTFAASASLTMQVQTICGTTSGTFHSWDVEGNWQ